jgi:hypothetical protein
MGGGTAGKVLAMCVFHGESHVLVETDLGGGGRNGIRVWRNGTWERVPNAYAATRYPQWIRQVGDELWACALGGIDAWNGTSWRPVASMYQPSALDVCRYQGAVYAARGSYGYDSVNRPGSFGKLNGTAWDSVPGAPFGIVQSMTEYRGKLVLTGNFWGSRGHGSSAIAIWDGQRWDAMGGVVGAPVNRLARAGDRIIAVGGFGAFDGQPAFGAAVREAGRWRGLEGTRHFSTRDSTAQMRAFALYDGDIIVGGKSDAETIFRWTGSAWAPMGSGSAWITSIAVLSDGGLWGGGLGSQLYRWDGSDWQHVAIPYPSTGALANAVADWGGTIVIANSWRQ